MYLTRAKQRRRLGVDIEDITALVDSGAKAVTAVKGKSNSGTAPTNAAGNWLEKQSNTTLAIGGLAIGAFLLAATK